MPGNANGTKLGELVSELSRTAIDLHYQLSSDWYD